MAAGEEIVAIIRQADREADARATYAALGLKMILTDAKLGDGGYPGTGAEFKALMAGQLRRALEAGERDVVITMHDTNTDTARDLEEVLGFLRGAMRRLGLGEGEDYRFAGSTSEVLEILRGKRAFALFPDARQ